MSNKKSSESGVRTLCEVEMNVDVYRSKVDMLRKMKAENCAECLTLSAVSIQCQKAGFAFRQNLEDMLSFQNSCTVHSSFL